MHEEKFFENIIDDREYSTLVYFQPVKWRWVKGPAPQQGWSFVTRQLSHSSARRLVASTSTSAAGCHL
jgi:hypothetical protein